MIRDDTKELLDERRIFFNKIKLGFDFWVDLICI